MLFNEAFAGQLPIQGTEYAANWDVLYNFLVVLSVFFFVLVIGGMIYFCFKYRHREGIKTVYMTGSHALEATWIVVPFLLLMVIFGWGFSVYRKATSAPTDAYEIHVVGRQWMWTFQYDTGRTTTNEIYVPTNRPVKLIMTSEDVLHAFFIPSFRIKQDVVPGMYTSIWFEATVPGKHQVFCTQYCGTSHSGMLAKLIALTDSQWKDWLKGKPLGNIPNAGEEETAPSTVSQADTGGDQTRTSQSSALQKTSLEQVSLPARGKHLFETKGCVACHTGDGSIKVGPSLKGIYGRLIELSDGKTLQADENYLRESIEAPNAKIVKGFAPQMPTFKGQLEEQEMTALISYIKSLK